MSDPAPDVTAEEIGQLQKNYSEIKHGIKNDLAVMMAYSEMSRRRPDYAENLATTILTRAPKIVSSLQEFTQILNAKAGTPPDSLSTKWTTPAASINNALAVMMASSEMSQRRPDYVEKLATIVLAKAPEIVTSLEEFSNTLKEKAAGHPEGLPPAA